jgi:F0F1-type ATP synthase assembly protein I
MRARPGNRRIEVRHGLAGTEGTGSVRGGSTAWALLGGQALTAAIAGLVVWIGWGPAASLAAMFGGITVILPTLYFAAKVHLRAGNATAAEVLGTFYRAEVMKLVLTALLFWIGAKWFGQHFAALILTTIACLAVNWVMVAVTKNW